MLNSPESIKLMKAKKIQTSQKTEPQSKSVKKTQLKIIEDNRADSVRQINQMKIIGGGTLQLGRNRKGGKRSKHNRKNLRLAKTLGLSTSEMDQEISSRGVIDTYKTKHHETKFLAEEDKCLIDIAGKIIYTQLAAGCLAVTVKFKGGGGAGVHLAMFPANLNQWISFYATLGGRSIETVFLDCDGWGGDEGWRVKDDEDSPKSTAQLVFGGVTDDKKKLEGLGWNTGKAAIQNWFAGKLGVTPKLHVNQNPKYEV